MHWMLGRGRYYNVWMFTPSLYHMKHTYNWFCDQNYYVCDLQVLQKLGKADETKDVAFEEGVINFNKQYVSTSHNLWYYENGLRIPPVIRYSIDYDLYSAADTNNAMQLTGPFDDVLAVYCKHKFKFTVALIHCFNLGTLVLDSCHLNCCFTPRLKAASCRGTWGHTWKPWKVSLKHTHTHTCSYRFIHIPLTRNTHSTNTYKCTVTCKYPQIFL